MKKLILIIVTSLIIAYFLFKIWTQFNGVEDGEKAPNFQATTITGEKIELNDLKGQYILLDFWGSWCPPCIRELPNMVKIHEQYPNNLQIVSVALEKTDDRWKKITEKYGISWKYQIVEINKLVMMSSIARSYGVTEIPAKFLITPDGKVLSGLSFEEISSILNVK